MTSARCDLTAVTRVRADRVGHRRTVGGQAVFCTHARCHDDVIAQALNKARPRYIGGSPIGAAVTRVSLASDQARAEVSVLVFDAMRRVNQNPRHGPADYVPLRDGG